MLTAPRSQPRDAARQDAGDGDRPLTGYLLLSLGYPAMTGVLGPPAGTGATRLVTGIPTAATGAEALHYGHAAVHRLEPAHE